MEGLLLLRLWGTCPLGVVYPTGFLYPKEESCLCQLKRATSCLTSEAAFLPLKRGYGRLKARSFVFPSGGPLCLPRGWTGPGLKTLMVASALPHLVVITLPMGLIGQPVPLPLRSAHPRLPYLPQRSLPWPLQRLKLVGLSTLIHVSI